MSEQSKIILFGGSFDPVHLGHIEILQFVHAHTGAAKSILIPARRSPLKNNAPLASNSQRFDMLKIATQPYPDFEVSDIEFNQPEPSYSFHTVRHFNQLYGDNTKLCWLAGADVIRDLHRWYKITEMLKMCEVILACRGGYGCPSETLTSDDSQLPESANRQITFLKTPLISISSTDIRGKVRQYLPIDGLVSAAVAKYLRQNRIYLPN